MAKATSALRRPPDRPSLEPPSVSMASPLHAIPAKRLLTTGASVRGEWAAPPLDVGLGALRSWGQQW